MSPRPLKEQIADAYDKVGTFLDMPRLRGRSDVSAEDVVALVLAECIRRIEALEARAVTDAPCARPDTHCSDPSKGCPRHEPMTTWAAWVAFVPRCLCSCAGCAGARI